MIFACVLVRAQHCCVPLKSRIYNNILIGWSLWWESGNPCSFGCVFVDIGCVIGKCEQVSSILPPLLLHHCVGSLSVHCTDQQDRSWLEVRDHFPTLRKIQDRGTGKEKGGIEGKKERESQRLRACVSPTSGGFTTASWQMGWIYLPSRKPLQRWWNGNSAWWAG